MRGNEQNKSIQDEKKLFIIHSHNEEKISTHFEFMFVQITWLGKSVENMEFSLHSQ